MYFNTLLLLHILYNNAIHNLSQFNCVESNERAIKSKLKSPSDYKTDKRILYVNNLRSALRETMSCVRIVNFH